MMRCDASHPSLSLALVGGGLSINQGAMYRKKKLLGLNQINAELISLRGIANLSEGGVVVVSLFLI